MALFEQRVSRQQASFSYTGALLNSMQHRITERHGGCGFPSHLGVPPLTAYVDGMFLYTDG